ncbi:MAG: tetratricopeptide repeat protein [Pseudoclavibacter sp.]|nr:tetratricopeptide repeat protein [Pseudoclavibacter sp.]
MFDALAAAGPIAYAEPPVEEGDPGPGQPIRPPVQILNAPRHGGCLDLALCFASACLDAQLHPLLVLLDPRSGRPAHALLLIRLDHDWKDPAGDAQLLEPARRSGVPELRDGRPLSDELRPPGGGPGVLLALDPTCLTEPEPDWDRALEHAHRLLHDTEWEWAETVDIGTIRAEHPGLPVPGGPEGCIRLNAPVHPARAGLSPHEQLQARRAAVPFVDTPEDPDDPLARLSEWCSPSSAHFAIRVLSGVGGAGKTRIATELCTRLAQEHWHTGFTHFSKTPTPVTPTPHTPTPLRDPRNRWLAGIVSPLLVVIDYADEYPTEDLATLIADLATRTSPTRILLTARTGAQETRPQEATAAGTDGTQRIRQPGEPERAGWWEHLLNDLASVRLDASEMRLPRRHEDHERLARKTIQIFTPEHTTRSPEEEDEAVATALHHIETSLEGRATNLDVLVISWLIAQNKLPIDPKQKQPQNPEQDQPQDSEQEQSQESHHGQPQTLSRAGFYDALFDHELRYWQRALEMRIKGLRGLAGAALTLTAPGTIRRATELLRKTFGCDKESDPIPGTNVVPRQIANTLADILDGDEIDSGLAVRPDPLGERLVLREFATDLDDDDKLLPLHRILPPQPAEHDAPTAARRQSRDNKNAEIRRATARLVTVINRASSLDEAGARLLAEECLHTAPHIWQEALTQAQQQAGPFVPCLEQLAQNADKDHLRTIAAHLRPAHPTLDRFNLTVTERTEPEPDPETGEQAPQNRAEWLQELALYRHKFGQHDTAQDAASESLELWRTLADTNPAHRPDLARALSNHAATLRELGHPHHAHDTETEAIDIYRDLVTTNPAHRPDLARALSNHAATLRELGHPHHAHDTETEAIDIYRDLVTTNPAHRPDLAWALTNHAATLRELGHHQHAHDIRAEAIDIYRDLITTNPTHRPNLAWALTNHAITLSELGNHQHAHDTEIEAIGIYRDLATTNPAHLPDLARALSNHATTLHALGHHQHALHAINEAIDIRRRLVDTYPSRLPELIRSLTVQVDLYRELGDRDAALNSFTDAAQGLASPFAALIISLRAVWRAEHPANGQDPEHLDEGIAADLRLAAQHVEQDDHPELSEAARRSINDIARALQQQWPQLTPALPEWMRLEPENGSTRPPCSDSLEREGDAE